MDASVWTCLDAHLSIGAFEASVWTPFAARLLEAPIWTESPLVVPGNASWTLSLDRSSLRR